MTTLDIVMLTSMAAVLSALVGYIVGYINGGMDEESRCEEEIRELEEEWEDAEYDNT